jgi:hypothetical protein
MGERRRRHPAFPGPVASAFRPIGLLGGLLLLALAALGPTCPPPPPPPVEPDDVRSIEDFVSCLNGTLAGNPAVDISDTVQCLPKKCTITLTMSNISAQPACFSDSCQLPRVLIECPGPPRFMPSYLLCHTDEGSERVEIGEAVDQAGNMRMADIHIVPGAYGNIDPNDVLSVNDSKGCIANGQTCHTSVGPQQDSAPIDPFDGTGNGNPNCIIDTDGCDPAKQEIEAEEQCFPPENGTRPVVPRTLDQICQCIRDSRAPGSTDLLADPHYDYIEKLCDALEDYQSTRGACTMADCPSATGLPCDIPGGFCDPSTGDGIPVASGYRCRANDAGEDQCIADCPCRGWDLLGGGKYLVNGAVTMVRVELDGLVATPDPGEFSDDDAITGTLSAFNYLTHTLIDSVSLSSLEATQTGADFTATGAGTGLVNGVSTNIEFDASQTGSSASFELRNADTSAVLAGGIGEDDRSACQLTVGP